MEGAGLFAWGVLAYSVLPLLYVVRRSSVQFLLLYTHLASLLTFGSLFGGIYELRLTDDLVVRAGELTYGGFVFATLVTVVVGRDLQVVRNIVALTAAVAAVGLSSFAIARAALSLPGAANPYSIDATLFGHHPATAVLFVVLVLVELLVVMALLETAKSRLPASVMPAVYPAVFVLVMALHGVLIPVINAFQLDLTTDYLVTSVSAKMVVTGVYLVPLLIFVGGYRGVLHAFEARPLHLRHLLSLNRDDLLAELDSQTLELAAQRARILDSTATMGRVNATVDRILDSATNTILVAMDQDLRITHFNAGAQNLLGWSTADVAGQGMEMLHSDEEIARHASSLGTTPDFREVVKVQMAVGARRDWEFVAKDGSRPMVSLSITEVVVDNHVVGHIAAGEDVTSRLRVEAAMMTALSREHDALVRLQEADRVKHELVSTVSHELRTPIASISGYTEMLSDGAYGELSKKQSEALERVLRNTARLEELVDDLLVLERVESAALNLECRPLDLSGVIRGTQEIVAEMVRGRDLKFNVALPANPVVVDGDPAALERLVLNLISNAVKFTPGHGTITLRISVDGTRAWLTVADTGIGIPEEDQAHLFSRFFRSAQANELAIPGSGLGLSIVHAVVAGHGGEVSVVSQPGEGTTVRVSLPLSHPVDHARGASLAG